LAVQYSTVQYSTVRLVVVQYVVDALSMLLGFGRII